MSGTVSTGFWGALLLYLFSLPAYSFENHVEILNAFRKNDIEQFRIHINQIPENEINYPINRNGYTLLHSVVASAKRTHLGTVLSAIDILVENGADPNAKDNSGKTPVFLVSNKKFSVEIFEKLLAHGSDYKVMDVSGNSLLHIYSGRDYEDIVEKLISMQVTIDAPNRDGVTPLMIAVMRQRLPIVKLLKYAGADFLQEDNNGNGLIHYAAKSRDFSLIDYVQKEGVPLNQKNRQEESVLSILAENKQWAAIRLLLEKGANPNVAYGRNVSLGLYLLTDENTGLSNNVNKASIDPNYSSVPNQHPLLTAVKSGNFKQAELLVSLGADVTNPIEQDIEIITKLAMLDSRHAENEILNLIKLAAEKGANINALGGVRKKTALMYAADRGKLDTVKLLLELGADPKIGTDGTSINYPISRQHYKVASLLINAGIDVDFNNFNTWLKILILAKDVEKEERLGKKGDATELFILLFAKMPVVDLSTVSGESIAKSHEKLSNSSSIVVLNNLVKAELINQPRTSRLKPSVSVSRSTSRKRVEPIKNDKISIPTRQYQQDAQLHVIGIYKGKSTGKDEPWWKNCLDRDKNEMLNCHQKYAASHQESPVEIHLFGSNNKSVILALMAYEPVRWVIKNPDNIEIDGVILSGYHGQRLSGLKKDVPVDVYTHKQSHCMPCQAGEGYFYAYKRATREFSQAMNALKQITGKQPKSFQGKYKHNLFTVMVK